MNTQTMERPSTKIATVAVQYVNPAKSPGKSGSIKAADGQYFGVRPAMLSSFEPGETYQIEFTEKVSNGVLYRDVVRVVAPEAPRQANFLSREEIEAQRRPAAQQQRTAPVQQHTSPPQDGNGNGYRPVDERTAKRMFLCATFAAYVQAGRVERNPEAMRETLDMLAQVYDEKIGNAAV